MIKIFRGGKGWWMGGSSEGCLKWGGGGGWVINKNILKQGMGKSKSFVRRGRAFDGVTTPPPPENFNHALVACGLTLT